MKQRNWISSIVVIITALMCAATIAVAETELISSQTSWRVWTVTGPRVTVDKDGKALVYIPGTNPPKQTAYSAKTALLSEMPAKGWIGGDYDDSLWGRYSEELFDSLGFGYVRWSSWAGGNPASLCLRTRFGVSDPEKATDLKVTLEYIGGAVVYVNGVEVGRGNMPVGAIEPYSLATAYPNEAYTVDDNQTPLPVVSLGQKPDPRWLDRYKTRIRTVTIDVPAGVLVKGTNVLALDLHRTAVSGPLPGGQVWDQLGIRAARLSSATGSGAIGYADALKGARVWSAQNVEQITDTPLAKSRIPGGWARGVCNLRGPGITGVAAGNPFDPLMPVRILVPRNGIGNGTVIVSNPDGLHEVTARVKDFTGPDGAVLPVKAVHVRFAAQSGGLHWCDTLQEQAPDGAKTLPVWLEVTAPKDQVPGWYVSTLSVEANGKTFAVPVQVFVTGYVVPDTKDFRSLIGVMHSPEVAAKLAQAAPWSEAHFAMMAKSLEVAGQLGNDIMYVPVMVGDHMGHQTGLIRWTKTDKGLQPDFTAFEKYLDLYTKYCAPPRAMILYVWSLDTAKEAAQAYENSAVPTRTYTPKRPLQVTQWDPVTDTNTSVTVPTFTDEGAEAFWKPMMDGVRAIVLKRGWSERIIMLGTGGDMRPSVKTGELFRQWAPYARWDIYSHYSADPEVGGRGGFFHRGDAPLPGSGPGKLVAIGNLEVGIAESPGGKGETGLQKWDFLDMPLHRADFDDRSPPMSYRTELLKNGRLARLGLDFWDDDIRYGVPIWGCYPIWLLARGATGPVPTVRLQMMREGVQDFEPRLTIMEAIEKLPADQRNSYQALLGEFGGRWQAGNTTLSQAEISLDWPGYVAKTYRTAEELTGMKVTATWDTPPVP